MLSGASRLPSCHATQSTNQEAEDVRFTFASAYVQNNFRFALKSTKGLFDFMRGFRSGTFADHSSLTKM